MSPPAPSDPGVSFHDLSSGGKVGDLIRRKDWASTPLGPRDSWPRSLHNHLSMIFEIPTAAIIFWGTELIQLYNDGYSVIMGPRHPGHLGSPFRECWPEAYATIHPWMQRVLQKGETVEVNRTLVPLTRFGFTEEAYFTFSFSPLRDDRGEIAGILQLVTEVTSAVIGERRAAALRELSNLTPRAKTIEDATRLATEVLGRHLDDLPFSRIYRVDSAARKLVLSGSTGTAPDSLPDEIDLRADGELPRAVAERRPLLIERPPALASPIAAADQHTVVTVLVTGISPRLALDAPYRGFLQLVSSQLSTLLSAARAYDDERKRADALAEIDRAKTAFVSNVSHELRTPLTLILGPASRLAADPATPPAHRDTIAGMERNARLLLKHVNDLLDVAKLEAGKLTLEYAPVDFAKLARQTAANFDSLAKERGFRFLVETPESLSAEVDYDKMQRVVMNLLSNAFKFTPAGGTIRCSVAGDDAEISLTVADSGPGIPEAHRASVFERFTQVGEQAGGTGLGLAIVKDFVELHAGVVALDAAAEGGARFTIRLPRRAPATATLGPSRDSGPALPIDVPSATPSEPDPVATGDQARILLVEDNPEMAGYIRESLGPGVATIRAVNGEEGLKKAVELRPDLILSDLMMPVMTGDRMLREIRSRRDLDSIPVVMLTAKADDEVRIQLLRDGAQDYLLKPFSPEELRARVGNLVTTTRVRRAAESSNRQLRTAQADLERLVRELEGFSYSVSHDLRAPLRAIEGFSRMLMEEYSGALDAEGRRLLSVVSESATRMSELIEVLLEFSRLGRKDLETSAVDMERLAREVLKEALAGVPGRRIEATVSPLPPARGDLALLRQVMANLLSNAVKYTGKTAAARIEIGGSAGPEKNTYWVTDNGAGFAMEYSRKLFKVFQRLHSEREFPGTGVGLALTERILARHGGTIRAESVPGERTTFTFTLPSAPR